MGRAGGAVPATIFSCPSVSQALKGSTELHGKQLPQGQGLEGVMLLNPSAGCNVLMPSLAPAS